VEPGEGARGAVQQNLARVQADLPKNRDDLRRNHAPG